MLTVPRNVETTVYTVDELPDAAKEAARAWYRENCLEYEWFEAVDETIAANECNGNPTATGT